LLKFKQKILLTAPLLVGATFLLLPLLNLIKDTLSFKPEKLLTSDSLYYSYEIYSSDNKLISRLSRKFDLFDNNEKIPKALMYAFISAEDKRFMSHNGFDFKGSIRAFRNNFQSGYIKEGGSTITQQVARILFLDNEKNFKRKLKEILISLILDFKYDKNQILKLYLNNIYLGSGAYGVNEAAQTYFGKFINQLNLSEIALIAGLAPAPSIYSPFNDINLAVEKRNRILNTMFKEGYISEKDFNSAIKKEIKLGNINKELTFTNDEVLINFILNETNAIMRTKKVNRDYKHIKVKSSINLLWQNKAQNLAKSIKPDGLEIALVTIESNKGLIRTMISGKEPILNTFNRANSAIRPLSSTFKIIPYIAAFQEGKNLGDIYYDEPSCWDDYCPKNFSNIYRGKISLIDAFKTSSNIIPIKISKELGLGKIINLANEFGLGYEQKIDKYLPLAIGAYGDSLLNITNVYSTINNNGNIIKPSILEKIESIKKETIWKNNYESKKLLTDLSIKKLKKILEKSVSEGNGIAASIKGEKIYGKTGTSDGNRDLWFIGSIKGLTTGVWLGFDDYKKTNLSSGNASLFWKNYIKSISISK